MRTISIFVTTNILKTVLNDEKFIYHKCTDTDIAMGWAGESQVEFQTRLRLRLGHIRGHGLWKEETMIWTCCIRRRILVKYLSAVWTEMGYLTLIQLVWSNLILKLCSFHKDIFVFPLYVIWFSILSDLDCQVIHCVYTGYMIVNACYGTNT